MFDRQALAVVIAGLDGHNPNVTLMSNGNLVSTPGNGPSDLQLATDDMLSQRMPTVAVQDVARAALAVAMATAQTLGAGPFDIDPKAIAAELRFMLQALAIEADE
ncbi:hypothetical protein CEY15_02315 [Dietzia natronolimnaea]|uniref:Uncharacterized protein n=1 Tax=Dietzia natronolimnaea TaxID=161920 RepID=A0A2A2WTW7_9ACTN|nr:hypothetical protein [Dietzia natronolimnaea]PAY24650.1 hypothetical protein CEY15_02315 [Dietzia natronolimnaea]